MKKNDQFDKKKPTNGRSIFLGPTPTSFCIPTGKIVDFSGIRTRIDGVEGEQGDHLTTTPAHRSNFT